MGNPHTIAQQLDGLSGQYKNQVPIVQVQPVTISQYAATFSDSILIAHYLILGFISQHRPDYSRVFISARHGRFIKTTPLL